MATEQNQRVGDYEVLALLGSGGMGRVYKVRNVISNREEAMKILLPDFASEPELAARFMAEIRTLAGLEHPNIAQLRTAFQLQNQFVMVMEYVEGATLDTVVAQSRIPLDQLLDYSMQVLSALSYAHSRGVTHRDIKPANIMITAHGLVKLMDFGIAKSTNDMNLTRPGTTMGSVYYISPEQVRGGTVDARSDIYSFGVTLYEMLAGRKPFQADTSYSVLHAQLNEAPTPLIEVNPTIPSPLNDIVMRSMAKAPEERFQSAEEFHHALKALLQPQAAPPVPQPVPQPEFKPVAAAVAAPAASKSRRGLWIGVGALVAILALVAVASVLPRFFATRADQKPAAAEMNMQTPAASTDTGSSAQPDAPAAGAVQQSSPLGAATPGSTPSAALNQTHTTANPSSMPSNVQPRQGAVSAAEPGPSASTAQAGPSAKEVRQTKDKLINLDARADSAFSGVKQIRAQQQAQGLDIRGDILASMSRMNNYLSEANRALSQNDLQSANEYMERADKEVSKLESFLGR